MNRPRETTPAIASLVTSVEKQFGRGAIMALGDDAPRADVAVVRSGSICLDHALGVGGYPRGCIIEIYGPESSGKTTLALHALAEAQRAGGVAALIDTDHAFDVQYARAIGVDDRRLLVAQPDTGEQALEIAEMLTRSGTVDVIAVDSLGAIVPKAELEGEVAADYGLKFRLLSQALRRLTATAHRTNTLVIFLNQLRQRSATVFGPPEIAGGNALKFYASLRVDVRGIAAVERGHETVGSRTRVRIVKNKFACPFKEAELDIVPGAGIDQEADWAAAGRLGVFEISGASSPP
jgi:recombination protein RecA